jgi:hypothetical protein
MWEDRNTGFSENYNKSAAYENYVRKGIYEI